MSGSPSAAADFCRFLRTPELPELGAGPRDRVTAARELDRQLAEWFAGNGTEAGTALRLRALALLYHDHHDPAHDIVQDLTDRDSALIHAMLHRREPDYWNAQYWFRRTSEHPVYFRLADRLKGLAVRPEEAAALRQLMLPGSFDPFAFVDLCEQVAREPAGDPKVTWLRQIQQAEFEAVAEHLLTA